MEVYVKSRDMFGEAKNVSVTYNEETGNVYAVTLPTGVENFSEHDLEWEGVDYNVEPHSNS